MFILLPAGADLRVEVCLGLKTNLVRLPYMQPLGANSEKGPGDFFNVHNLYHPGCAEDRGKNL